MILTTLSAEIKEMGIITIKIKREIILVVRLNGTMALKIYLIILKYTKKNIADSIKNTNFPTKSI
jgi:hypothetical protein